MGRAERQRRGTLCRSLAGLGEYRHLEDELGPCGPGGDLDATAQAVAVRHEGEKILRDFSGGLRPRGGKMAIGELPARRAILAALAGHRRIQGAHRHASCWRFAWAVQRSGEPVARFTWMVRAPVRRSFTLTRKFA